METTMRFISHGALTDPQLQIKLIWATAIRTRKLFEKRNNTIRMQMVAPTAAPQSIKSDFMGKNQHVVPNNGKWSVRGAGNSRVTQTFDTRREAIARAREIAINQQSELFIHNRQGQFRERNSYGNDPYPPEG